MEEESGSSSCCLLLAHWHCKRCADATQSSRSGSAPLQHSGQGVWELQPAHRNTKHYTRCLRTLISPEPDLYPGLTS